MHVLARLCVSAKFELWNVAVKIQPFENFQLYGTYLFMVPNFDMLRSELWSMALVDPIDYEKFVKENRQLLEESDQRDLLLFPDDDVTVTTVPRKFRTVDIPVPEPAKWVIYMYTGTSS